MTKIPKIIHYCWVGDKPKPKSVLYCIESWKRYCPDYEIREWNETNYDFTKNEYMRQAYEAKKWGFVPDYARLDIVYEHGGIYLDTDVEMVRSFDELLEHDSFFGFEDTGEGTYFVACGLGFGAVKHNALLKKLRDYYDGVCFLNPDGSLNLTPAPRHNTPLFTQVGVHMNNKYQILAGNAFYPSEYFCPKIFKTGKTKVTKRTFSIHHFSASWMDERVLQEIIHTQRVTGVLGKKLGQYALYAESVWKKYGFFGLPKRLLIQIYEELYSFWPLLCANMAKPFRKNEHGVLLFDTAMGTSNAGDYVIMENCQSHLERLLKLDDAVHISTHDYPVCCNQIVGKYKIVCGTNILSGRMRQYRLWKLPDDLQNFHNITLMGVGFDSKEERYDLYTKLLLRTILTKRGIHSVRDSFSEKKLKAMGINNVLNTGCPTMWNLTPEHCAAIPSQKARNVVSTVTDYNQDPQNDAAMLDILLENYETVYLWLQGREDLGYIRELGYGDKLVLIPGTLADYDAILAQEDLDYVGTRLHAGIRALSKGHRSLVVSIDNRAECISADTALPLIRRENIPATLGDRVNEEFETRIHMPWETIEKWKRQFK